MPLGLTTPPGSGQLPIGNAGGTGYTNQTVSGDATLSNAGALTVTKTNGTTFGILATQSTSGASILKGNGSGGLANAVSGADYQAPIAGNSLAAHNFVNSISASGVVSGAQPAFSDIAGTVGSGQFGAGSIPSSALILPLAGNAVTLGGDITGASNATTAIQFHPSGKTIGTSGSNYNVLPSDSLLIVNNTSGGLFTATLPVMANTVNQMVCFKRYDNNIPAFEAVVNPSPGTDTIEGSTHGLWMGGGTNGGLAVGSAKGMLRCLWNDGSSDWKIVRRSWDPSDLYMRLIPTGDITANAGTTTTIASGSMGCYNFDPGAGNAFVKIEEGELVYTYTTAPTDLTITLTENASGTPHSDGHGYNGAIIPASPVHEQTPGLVDTNTSLNDNYAPWQTWCIANNTCIATGQSWYGAAACCTGAGTGTCPGGVALSITAKPSTNPITFKKGAAVGGNGADSAELAGVHLHMIGGGPVL
jgi:hypothetical protein